MTVELEPLCTVEISLREPIVVGEGPAGLRMIYEVASGTVTGDRVSGTLRGDAAADWVTVNGTVGTLDVRATIETDDGAVIYAHYSGRTDIRQGPGVAPIYCAPLFETGDERYAWLNAVQGVGKGVLDGDRLTYEWHVAS